MLSATDAAAEIKRMVNDDPTISGGTYILVFARKKGFGPWKKEEIHLSGHVANEIEKKKVEELAQHSAAGRTIVNAIEISP